jgi:mono/diheme cytochrome c family protein
MRALCALAIPALATFFGACGDTTLFDPMERQPKGRPFGANPFFEDGRSMRTPPAGTVPREQIVQNAAITQGKSGGRDLTEIPVPITRALLETGRKKFDIYCATCHGLLGDGNSIVATKMSLRPPPNLHEKRHQTVGHYFQVISGGFGLMASYAAELEVEERWAVIAYLRALQLSQNTPLALAPAEERERLQREPRK